MPKENDRAVQGVLKAVRVTMGEILPDNPYVILVFSQDGNGRIDGMEWTAGTPGDTTVTHLLELARLVLFEKEDRAIEESALTTKQ